MTIEEILNKIGEVLTNLCETYFVQCSSCDERCNCFYNHAMREIKYILQEVLPDEN